MRHLRHTLSQLGVHSAQRVCRWTAITLTSLLLIAHGVNAAPSDTPRQVAENYMMAVSATNWPRAAAQMHPQSLAVIHRLFIDTYERNPNDESFTRLYGVADLIAFRQLSPEDFFVRFMSAALNQDPNFLEAMKHIRFEVVDEKMLSKDEYLIRYNATLDADNAQVSDTDTMVLRRSSLGWKIYSTPDLEPLLQRAESNAQH